MRRLRRTNQSGQFAGPAEDLRAALARERDLESARREDELARLHAAAAHQRHRADVAEQARLAELDRGEREASASAAAALARMYRQARDAGERIRIEAHMARSGEARALRLARLRAMNLRVLVPVLLGFAAWSTTGVHHGAAWLMRVNNSTAMWWALWILEPVLIGAVVWVIITRARLASAGGRLSPHAARIAVGCLATSVCLNLIAAAAGVRSDGLVITVIAAVLGSMLAHAIGPLGAAATAHLIGVIDTSITNADPWHERGEPVPLLTDLHLDIETSRAAGPSRNLEPGEVPVHEVQVQKVPRRVPLEAGSPVHPEPVPNRPTICVRSVRNPNLNQRLSNPANRALVNPNPEPEPRTRKTRGERATGSTRTMPGELGDRVQKKVRDIQQVLNLMTELGYDAVNLAEVQKRLNLTKTTAYNRLIEARNQWHQRAS